MSDPNPLGPLLASARRRAAELAAEVAADPRTQEAMQLASAGAAAAARRLDPALRAMRPPEDSPWDEVVTAVDELVEVALMQQQLIENLIGRIERLEGRA